VSVDSIPADVLETKRREILDDPATQAKPESVREKIVDGQLRKWYEQVVLLEQPYRDTEINVKQLITDAIATIGENIVVRRFTRYELGEDA
jgi:elongation factor Ts